MTTADGLRRRISDHPKRAKILFPIFDQFDYSGVNARWKNKSERTVEQRRCDRADGLFDKLVRGTEFELMNGWHCLRHSFISMCVANGLTWEQIAEWAVHVSRATTKLYTHFNVKDSKRRIEGLGISF